MAQIEKQTTEVVFVLRLSEAEMTALYHGLTLAGHRFDTEDERETATKLDALIFEALNP